MATLSFAIRDILVDAGIGKARTQAGVNDWWIFISRLKDDVKHAKVITIYDQLGEAPEPGLDIDRPGFQIVVRGETDGYQDAAEKAAEIQRALLGLPRTETDTGDIIASVYMSSGIAYMGVDANERPELSLNFQAIVHPILRGWRQNSGLAIYYPDWVPVLGTQRAELALNMETKTAWFRNAERPIAEVLLAIRAGSTFGRSISGEWDTQFGVNELRFDYSDDGLGLLGEDASSQMVRNQRMIGAEARDLTNLVTNGDFAVNPVDAAQNTILNGWQWRRPTGGTGTVTFLTKVTLTGDGTNTIDFGSGPLTTVVGRKYTISFLLESNPVNCTVGTTPFGNEVANFNSLPISSINRKQLQFVATATTTYIKFYRSSAASSTVSGVQLYYAGKLPDLWASSIGTFGHGICIEIPSIGVEDGFEYFDFRLLSHGTTSAGSGHNWLQPEVSNMFPATLGESYTASLMARWIAGSFAPFTNYYFSVTELDNTTAYLSQSNSPQLTNMVAATLKDRRYSVSRTLSLAGVSYVRTSINLSYPISSVIDITVRLAMWQLEPLDHVTSPMRAPAGQTGSVVRALDRAMMMLPEEMQNAEAYTLFVDAEPDLPTSFGNAHQVMASLTDNGHTRRIQIRREAGGRFGAMTSVPAGTVLPDVVGSLWLGGERARTIITSVAGDQEVLHEGGVVFGESTGAHPPNIDRLNLLSRFDGTQPGNGRVFMAAVWCLHGQREDMELLVGAGDTVMPDWVPIYDDTPADFVVNPDTWEVWYDGSILPLEDWVDSSRNGIAEGRNIDGDWTQYPAYTLRRNYRNGTSESFLTVEDGRSNIVINPRFVNAVLGLNGTIPNAVMATAFLPHTLTALGQTDGIDWFEIEFSGVPTTATNPQTISFQTGVGGTIGELVAIGLYVQVVAGDFTNIAAPVLRVSNEVGVTIFTPDNLFRQYTNIRIMAATSLDVLLRWNYNNNTTPVYLKLRIGLPSLERAALYVSSPMRPTPGLTGAASRLAETNAITLPPALQGAAEYTILTEGYPNSPNNFTAQQYFAQLSDDTANNRLGVLRNLTTGAYAAVGVAGGATVLSTTNSVWPQNARGRLAYAGKGGDHVFYREGGIRVGVGTGAFPAGLMKLYLGAAYNNASHANGDVGRTAIWKKRIPDLELKRAVSGDIPSWVAWLNGVPASVHLDPFEDRAFIQGVGEFASYASALTFVRASLAYSADIDGEWFEVPANQARFEYASGKRWFKEEVPVTNKVQNPHMVGAAAGAGAAMPTGWNEVLSGLSRTNGAVRTTKGLQELPISYSGTASLQSTQIKFSMTTGNAAPAVQNEVWTISVMLTLLSGSWANITNIQLGFFELTGAGAFLATNVATLTNPSGTMLQFSTTRTVGNASTALIQPLILINQAASGAVAFEIGIAAPSCAKENFVSSPMLPPPGTIADSVRAGERAYIDLPVHMRNLAEYTLVQSFTVPPLAMATNTFPTLAGLRQSTADTSVNSAEIFMSNVSATNRASVLTRTANVDQALVTSAALNLGPGFSYKIASRHMTNNARSIINGAFLTANDTSGSVPPNLDRLVIGNNGTASPYGGLLGPTILWAGVGHDDSSLMTLFA